MPAPFFPSGEEEDLGIFFSSEDFDFQLDSERQVAEWLQHVIEQEGKSLRLLNFIFCSDEYLHRLNVQYLQHDTLTDIITFPYGEPPYIEGDIFMSIERVRENARKYRVSFEEELHRVMVHGVLHLCGYGDKTGKEKKVIRRKETEALALRNWE